jgi:hypothetical protein
MSNIQNTEPKIVSVQILKSFKEHFLDDLGITTANKSIIQTENNISNIAKSIIIGEGHSNQTENTLQNILVTGFRNIASTNNQAIFGLYNKPTDSLFVVGGGTDSDNRHNAFEVTKNGIVKGNANVTIANANTFTDDTLVPLGYIKELSLPDNTMIEAAVNTAIAEKLPTTGWAFSPNLIDKLDISFNFGIFITPV